MTSPPEGVTARHQVASLIPEDRERTLPSVRPTAMPPGWAVEARVGSQAPSLGLTWNFEPGPMALGAPRFARPAMAKPGWNARDGRFMGGGCQGKTRPV